MYDARVLLSRHRKTLRAHIYYGLDDLNHQIHEKVPAMMMMMRGAPDFLSFRRRSLFVFSFFRSTQLTVGENQYFLKITLL